MPRISRKAYSASLARVQAIKNQSTYEAEVLNRRFDVKTIRKDATGLSQAKFAEKYHLKLQTLKQWEKSPAQVRSSIRSYLNMIYLAPDLVDSLLNLPEEDAKKITKESPAVEGVVLSDELDVSKIRKAASDLSQSRFAKAFLINLFTLQKWEQDPSRLTPPTKAYMFLINRAPLLVRQLVDAQTTDDVDSIKKSLKTN